MRKLLTFLLLTGVAFGVQAQSWEVGASAGLAGYMGDLNPNNPLKVSGGAAGILVKRNFNEYFSLRAGATAGSIAGADSTSGNLQFVNRNLSFKTSFQELSLVGEINFMKYIPSVTTNRYTPYLFIGGAVTHFTPQATYQGQTYDLEPLKTEGQAQPYQTKTIAAIYGAGIKLNFAESWNLIADIGYRNAYTDYLDDVSGVYAPATSFSNSNPVAFKLADRSLTPNNPGTQRGDLRPHDTYFFINLTLSFTFITAKCYY